MNRLNWIFTWASVSVLLVTVEQFSFTGKVFLQPDSFLRLHELVQMSGLILLTVILPLLMLKEVTGNLARLKEPGGWKLLLLFVIGVYFYATGNGFHEASSFYFNSFCDVNKFVGSLCTSLFINDYYTGNILYFLGGILMIMPILYWEKSHPVAKWSGREMKIMVANAVFYALAIFAYAGFDRVLVGLVYSAIVALWAGYLWWQVRKEFRKYPVISYTALTYTLGVVGAMVVRMR